MGGGEGRGWERRTCQVASWPSSTTIVKRNQWNARSNETIDLATFAAGGCVRTSVGYLSFELTSTCEHFCTRQKRRSARTVLYTHSTQLSDSDSDSDCESRIDHGY